MSPRLPPKHTGEWGWWLWTAEKEDTPQLRSWVDLVLTEYEHLPRVTEDVTHPPVLLIFSKQANETSNKPASDFGGALRQQKASTGDTVKKATGKTPET